MLYQNVTNGSTDTDSVPNDKTFYIIGGLMLIGGLISLINNYFSAESPKIGMWMVNAITALGGLAFIYVQYNKNKVPHSSSIFSIFMDNEKIKVLSEYGTKCEELFYGEIAKIDFQNDNIHLHSKSNAIIDINLILIKPEEKREELKTALKRVMAKI